jgi:RHS repeat-associated protein
MGAMQTQYTFDPFGNTSSTGTASTNSFAYTGRELDATGLYYYRARYYNPTLQRFISEDPIWRGGACLYAYVHDNPANGTDPSGLCPIYVGHRAEITMLPTVGPPISIEHTFLVLGGRKDKNRTVLEGEPDGAICPWCHPKIDAETYPLIPGLDPKNPVWTDPEIFVTDDGLPCSVDANTLEKFKNGVNAAGVPYSLLGPNSNSVTSGGLNALGVNNWSPPIIAPGWNSPIPH